MKAYCRQCVKGIWVKEGEVKWRVSLNGKVQARTVCPDCGNPTGTRIGPEDQAPHEMRVASQEVRKAVRHSQLECRKLRDAAIILLISALGDNPSRGRQHSRAKAPELHEALSDAFGLSVRRIREIARAGDVDEASTLVNKRRRSSTKMSVPPHDPDRPFIIDI